MEEHRRGYNYKALWSSIGWLMLNGFVMIVSRLVITVRATQLIDRGA